MSIADVNGLRIRYQTRGQGRPLILLHGGFRTGGTFDPISPALAEHMMIISPDLQGHGGTADIDRPLSYQAMADDVAALIRHLGFDQADVLGYSLGGGTALRLAIQHPGLVRRLIVVSQPCRRDGWFPEVLAGMDHLSSAIFEGFRMSQVYEEHVAAAPRPDDFPALMDKMNALFRHDYDWSAELAAISARVLLVFADADAVRPGHIAEFYALFGGGLHDAGVDGSRRPAAQLAILPGRTHYDMISPELAAVALRFLSTPPPRP